jgi:hypothetical protein
MVPSSFHDYLGAAASAAAALIGLLFVAVSVREESIFGAKAMPGAEAVAITAFAGLVNSFVVSLLGLLPHTDIGTAAAVMAVISIVTIVRVQDRRQTTRSHTLLGLTLIAYTGQLICGLVLTAKPHDTGLIPDLAYIMFASLVVSLERAWTLLKGKHIILRTDAASIDPGAEDSPETAPTT